MEEDIDYLAPYIARAGSPEVLRGPDVFLAREQCMDEFKEMVVNRANNIQRQFEMVRQNVCML